MTDVNGFNVPEDLYYWVEKHVWARPEDGGTVRIGMTDVAQHLAKKIIVAKMKAPGRTLAKGQSAGTIESGKFVGPVPAPAAGEIVEVNGALAATPSVINEDPYGKGWLARLRPADWEAARAELVTGAEGIERYRAFLEAQGIKCEM